MAKDPFYFARARGWFALGVLLGVIFAWLLAFGFAN
jgi:hypothetical protein